MRVGIILFIFAVILVLATGCAAGKYVTGQYEHVSHIHKSPKEEDSIDQMQLCAGLKPWETWFMEACHSYMLRNRGFKGGDITHSFRIGKTIYGER